MKKKRAMFIKENKLGIGVGFIFGGIVPFLFGLAVISPTVGVASEWLLPVLSPFYFWSMYGQGGGLEINFPLIFLLNAILFSFVGLLVQTYLRKIKKNQRIVVYFFVALASIPFLLFLIDLLLGRLGA